MATLINETRSIPQFFVSEAGDFYLVGSAEAEFLITQDAIALTNETRN